MSVPPRTWPERVARFRADRLGGQGVPSLAELEARIDERTRTRGETAEQALEAVLGDLERAGAALTTRSSPLVPASGLLVAGAGAVAKVDDRTTVLAVIAVAVALVALSFAITALFTHAGRRTVALAPAGEDVAYARRHLIRKEASAQLAVALDGLGLLLLLIALATL